MTQDISAKVSLLNPKNYDRARDDMVKLQIRTWDVLDPTILSLFSKVPREDFVPKEFESLAFADIAIPLPQGQSMMLPKEEARILQALRPCSQDKAVVMGVESGFLVTLLSHLAHHVFYVNNELDSFEQVRQKTTQYKLPNVTCLVGNLQQGWHDHIPYDVILLTGSLPEVHDELRNALAINGRLFVVVGKAPVMEATLVTRLSETSWNEVKLFETCRPRMAQVKELSEFIF